MLPPYPDDTPVLPIRVLPSRESFQLPRNIDSSLMSSLTTRNAAAVGLATVGALALTQGGGRLLAAHRERRSITPALSRSITPALSCLPPALSVGTMQLPQGTTCELMSVGGTQLLRQMEVGPDRLGEEGMKGPVKFHRLLRRGHQCKLVYNVAGNQIQVADVREAAYDAGIGPFPPGRAIAPLKIDGTWAFESNAGASPSGSNVFGGSRSDGRLFVVQSDFLRIPFYNALDVQQALFVGFGVRLIKMGEWLPEADTDLLLVDYTYGLDFANDYVHGRNGPGVFLEHHKFTHFITPSTMESFGPITIGSYALVNVSEVEGKTSIVRQMNLCGVHVPFGYTLVVPGGGPPQRLVQQREIHHHFEQGRRRRNSIRPRQS